jgi:hypothetical protein
VPTASASASALPSASASAAPIQLDPDTRDPLQLMRVAEMHRAKRLLAVCEARDKACGTALLALAYADDVELVLSRLGDLAGDKSRDDRAAIVTLLREVAYRKPSTREPLDPENVGRCIAALRRLAADDKEDEALRGLATSALFGFARAGRATEPAVATPSSVSPGASASAAPSSSASSARSAATPTPTR